MTFPFFDVDNVGALTVISGPIGGAMLLEYGDFMLLEDGSYMLLE